MSESCVDLLIVHFRNNSLSDLRELSHFFVDFYRVIVCGMSVPGWRFPLSKAIAEVILIVSPTAKGLAR